MPTTNNKGNILSELGIEKAMINNIFKSSENPELIKKHEPKKSLKNRFVRLSKMNPENEIFCTLDTNPENMFLVKEEQELEEQLFILKSPNHGIEPTVHPFALDVDEQPLLELIPCNCGIKENQPNHLGIGREKQLKKTPLLSF